MNIGLWVIIGILFLVIVFLLIKLYFFQKSAKEIQKTLADKLRNDTNTLIDISSHEKSMRELACSINTELRKLRVERQRFQQGDLELKEAITNISHDLRTPLTAICGYLDLLRQEETSETADRYLGVIKNRTEALKQLTEELFRYSITTSTIHDITWEDVTLNSVLEESISVHYAALKGSRITPSVSIPEKKIIRCLDKRALSRIFGNVIGNALKYSDGDLNITLSENGEIVFSNHASQLSTIQAGQLFDRYYTVETAKNSTGLGLSIARILTEQMKGTITAQYTESILSIRIRFS